jgi:methyltransferase-like protein 6
MYLSLSTPNILKMEHNDKISQYWHQKYRHDLGKNWNLFYARNATNFFRDRHWIKQEFPELTEKEGLSVFEVGCGVGNFLFPLMEVAGGGQGIQKVYGCDVSAKAVQLFQENSAFLAEKMTVFVADILKDRLRDRIIEPVDGCTTIFVLSALPPEALPAAIKNIWECLKGGGWWFIRDYAVGDAAQLRFDPTKSKLQKNLYVRQDGTLANYFEKEELLELLMGSGLFRLLECKQIESKTVNKKEGLDLDRLFWQIKLEKLEIANDF